MEKRRLQSSSIVEEFRRQRARDDRVRLDKIKQKKFCPTCDEDQDVLLI